MKTNIFKFLFYICFFAAGLSSCIELDVENDVPGYVSLDTEYTEKYSNGNQIYLKGIVPLNEDNKIYAHFNVGTSPDLSDAKIYNCYRHPTDAGENEISVSIVNLLYGTTYYYQLEVNGVKSKIGKVTTGEAPVYLQIGNINFVAPDNEAKLNIYNTMYLFVVDSKGNETRLTCDRRSEKYSWVLNRAMLLDPQENYTIYGFHSCSLDQETGSFILNSLTLREDQFIGVQKNINVKNPRIDLTMAIPTSKVTLKISKSPDYPSNRRLWRLTWSSYDLAGSALYNYKTNELTKRSALTMEHYCNINLTNTPVSYDYYLLPGELNAHTFVKLSIYENNSFLTEKEINLPETILEAGKSYEFSIVLEKDKSEQPKHEWVDLGLPSGTKWATCNVGATTPEEFGSYFAWGETVSKYSFGQDGYSWYGLSQSTLRSKGVIDSKGNLTAQYDAATANWGADWRMPTKEELDELVKYCSGALTYQNNTFGCKFTGKNGNTLFLPAAGYFPGSSHYAKGTSGEYYSSTISNYKSYDYCPYNLSFFISSTDNKNYIHVLDYMGWGRYEGCSVRAVLKQ